MPFVIDVHVHIAAKREPGCKVSRALERQPSFAYMLLSGRVSRARLRRDFDGTIRDHVLGALDAAPSVDRAVLLALDAIHDERGARLDEESHLVVANDYVRDLARAHPKVLFGASVHPNRGPAAGREELARCIGGDPPAALVKWIPNAQRIDPADPRHDWFYEALAEAGVPLLCHTGPEHAVPVPRPAAEHQRLGDPRRLRRALDAGVTVIAAHAGASFFPFERGYVGELAAMMRESEANGRWRLFADVSAFCLPCRVGTIRRVLERIPPGRMVLGSDVPVPVVDMPPGLMPGLSPEAYYELLAVASPIEKNLRQLAAMGFPAGLGARAADLIPPRCLAGAPSAGVG